MPGSLRYRLGHCGVEWASFADLERQSSHGAGLVALAHLVSGHLDIQGWCLLGPSDLFSTAETPTPTPAPGVLLSSTRSQQCHAWHCSLLLVAALEAGRQRQMVF